MIPTPTDPREEKLTIRDCIMRRFAKVATPTWEALCQLEADEISKGKALEIIRNEAELMERENWKLLQAENDDLQSTNSKLAAEVERLKTACEKEFQSVEQLSGENMKLAAENAEKEKELERAEEGLRGVCLLLGFDPSDGEGTSPEEVVEMVDKELATLRAELETAKLTLFQTEKRLDGKLRAALAELDAVRKERDEQIEQEQARFQSGIERVYLEYCPDATIDGSGCDSGDPLDFTISELRQAFNHITDKRDTALAAKDAAEKAVKVRDDLLTSAMGVIAAHGPNELWEAIRDLPALTPAPTQEPPAGGVTISNDSGGGYNSATESVLSPDASACDTASKKSDGPIDRALGHYETYSAVTSSNSPADVPSEGRGEWMPIETAPKDGTRILIWNQAMHGTPTAEVAYYSEPLPLDMKRWWKNRNKLFLDVTHWQPLPPPPTLPTEGSGA